MKNGDTSIHKTGLTQEEMEGVGNKFHQGLTKREYFAAKAMHGLAGDYYERPSIEDIVGVSVKMADALLRELENV